MKKILITGANGFLAKSVCDLLDFKDSEIIALVRPGTKLQTNTFSRVYSDLDSLLLNEKQFTVVFHFAAFIPYGAMDRPDQQLVDTNILFTGKLASFFSDARFVYASSVAVYGKPSKLPIEIESSFENPDLYGLSKLAGEAIVSNHPNHAIIRFSSIIGQGLQTKSFIPMIIKKALETRVITILGDGSRKQNYIDVRDAASLCLACASYEKNIIVLGTAPQSYSNKEIAEIVASYTKAKLTFTGLDESQSFIYSMNPGYSQLNFHPAYSIEKSIAKMIKE